MSPEQLPIFERAPVVETVLGAQFDRLPKLKNAHFGLFLATLPGEWTGISDAEPLALQFETFGEQRLFETKFDISLMQEFPSARMTVRNAAGNLMLQVQNGRIHLNWLGANGGEYPHYAKIRLEFSKLLDEFTRFVASRELGELRLNQWEITYVNHIPQGTVWNTPTDWPSVVRLLPCEHVDVFVGKLQAFSGEWHHEITPEVGRLHIHLKNGLEPTREKIEILLLSLTARGPIQTSVLDGLDVGRAAIVSTFAEITTESAQEYWGRQK